MPFTQSYQQLNHVDLHIMSYADFDPKEYEDHLTEEEKERLLTFGSKKRRQEFTATRVLRHSIFGFTHIHYTAIGSPYIPNEGYISISHAKGVVGIAVCKKGVVALDLERVTPKAKQLHLKYLNDREVSEFDCSSELEMTKAWSAKEVLYKLAESKGLDFKKDLLLYNRLDGLFGEIRTSNGTHTLELISIVTNDLVTTLNKVE